MTCGFKDRYVFVLFPKQQFVEYSESLVFAHVIDSNVSSSQLDEVKAKVCTLICTAMHILLS